ncbi:MAG: hypothetical protein M5U14_13425 [Acidimicrobiia bacterium]|nr:hypothetical protein [Acidimicrobiia bacterium]
MGDGVIPEAVLAELPPSSRPSAVYTGHDGFSPLGPILFEVDRAPDPASLPADGGATLRVFDVTAGVEVPIRAEISEEAARRGGHVVVAWPRTRFEFGHRYVAALTDRLVPLGGGAYRPSPGFAEAIRGGLSPLGLRYGLLRLYLAWRGIRAADLVSATYFTVRSEADATDPLRSMAATAYARPHPVRDVRALPNLFGIFGASVSTIVVGEVQVTDFRDARGEIHHRAGDQGTPRWLDFLLTVPRSAAHRPAPVAVYGHGITMVKETMIVVTEANAARGVATIAIDQPNHGSRAASEGGLIQELARPEHVGRLQSIIIQSSIDQVSVLRAVETSLADLDVVNPRPWSVGVPDGRADLDPGRVLYEGTSMGGVLGSAFTAVAPTVEGSAFQVTGAGIMNILTHSRVWEDLAPGVGFRDAVPQTANGAEALALVAGLQFAIDGGDGLTVAHRYRRPYPATGAKSVLVLYGVGDGVVFNPSSEALAAVAGLPLLERSVYPIPGLPVVPELPADGSAVYQIDTSGIPGPLRPSLAHISFLGREPMRVLGEWLDHVLEAGG